MIKQGLLLMLVLPNMILLERPCNSIQEQSIPVAGYRLTWSDEFDGKTLDGTKWKYRALGQRGDAINTESSVYLDGRGNLVIEAGSVKDKIYAGIIDTEGLFETRYGYFECRAKLPMIAGIWPAFWLQSSSNRDDTEPATAGAEIDIFEYFHHERRDTVSHSLHWGGYGRTHKVAGPVLGPMKKTNDSYHVFGLEWTPDSYSTFVDGVKTYTGNTLISGVPEFIVLSLEVNQQVAGPLDRRDLPGKFIVDYVRVYKKLAADKPSIK
jgi:beta-glucanase (GH16 family)